MSDMTPEREKLIRRTWSAYQTGYEQRRVLADLLADPEIRMSRQVNLPFEFQLTDYRPHEAKTPPDPKEMYATYRFEREAVAFEPLCPVEAYRHRVVCEGLILEEHITPLEDDRRSLARMRAALRHA